MRVSRCITFMAEMRKNAGLDGGSNVWTERCQATPLALMDGKK